MTSDRGSAPHQPDKIACPSTSLKRVAGIATRGIHKYKTTRTLLEIPPTSKIYLPPDFGKSSQIPAVRSNPVYIFQACVEARGPHELNQLPPIPHPATTILAHMRVNGVQITAERGMTTQELTRAILYGSHSSAIKETAFIRTELAKQAWAGHIYLFPLRAVHHLP